MKVRNVTAAELTAGDKIYIDGNVIVESVEPGTEYGQPVIVVKGTNSFGRPVARWTKTTATYRVNR